MQNGGYRQGAAKAPEKGSFPLDHFAECTELFRTYMTCLKQCDGDNRACKEPQKLYLVCRMEKGLMLPDELSRIGFDEQSMKQLDISTRYFFERGLTRLVFSAASIEWHAKYF